MINKNAYNFLSFFTTGSLATTFSIFSIFQLSFKFEITRFATAIPKRLYRNCFCLCITAIAIGTYLPLVLIYCYGPFSRATCAYIDFYMYILLCFFNALKICNFKIFFSQNDNYKIYFKKKTYLTRLLVLIMTISIKRRL